MNKRYECLLEAVGYRLKVTVFARNLSEIEHLARKKAAELLAQVYRLSVMETDFKLLSIQEK